MVVPEFRLPLPRFIYAAVFLIASGAFAQTSATPKWVGTWAASQQIPTAPNALPADALRGATLRQMIHLSLGGPQLRLRLSNAFGTEPLHLRAVHLATPKSPAAAAIEVSTDRAVTFDGGKADVTIPPGAEYLSDVMAYPVAPLADVAVTLQYDNAPNVQTGHPGSRATSYLLHDADPAAADMPGAEKFDRWFQIAGVDVAAPAAAGAVVTFGDSITDGHGATTNGNDRWPDDLAARLQASAAGRNVGVLNQGLGGNRILLDGSGPNAMARFTRDVLAQPGAKYLVVFEGINDLGVSTRLVPISPAEHEALVAHILSAYQQMIDRAHAANMRVYGATITPDTGFDFYHPDAANEADRQKINAWIRAAGHFDAVLDFDKLIADPAQPSRLLPKYDSGDHLHPSAEGFHVMANSIPLELFTR